MSSARVESPLLLQDLQRQPSPPSVVSRMPKPRACRKLFAVDRDAPSRLWEDELARMEGERRAFGFDFDRGEPLPDPDGTSRYTDWEAVPEARVPSFYHETVARRNPCRPSMRPRPALFPSSSRHQSSNNGHSNPPPPCSSGRVVINAVPAIAPAGTGPRAGTRSRPSGPAQLQVPGLQPANPSSSAGSSTHPPSQPPPSLEQVGGSAPTCVPGSASESTPGDTLERPETGENVTRTQCKITEFMRHRKRTGSDRRSVPSSDADGAKHAQVPAKRRRHRSGSPVGSPHPTGRS